MYNNKKEKWRFFMFCIYCGNRLAQNARFCSACGKPVQTSASKPASVTNTPTKQKTSTKKKTFFERISGCLTAILIVAFLGLVAGELMDWLLGSVTGVKTAPETADNTSVHLSTVPKSLRDHYYLQDRGKGVCDYMTNDIVVTVVFADDDESHWTSEEITAFMEDIQEDIEHITQAASGWIPLNIGAIYRHCAVEGTIAPDNVGDFFNQLVTNAQLPTGSNAASVQVNLKQELDAQAVPLIFAVNKHGRSYASHSATAEYAVLFKSSNAFKHELYHLFGAEDYYYPQEVTDAANKYFGECIMSNSSLDVMDSLTAFLIGWTDELSVEAIGFLNATSDLTTEYLQQAAQEQQVSGYGVLDYGNGSIYVGELSKGVPHGYGKMTWFDGRIYEGDWSGGWPHGRGVYMWPDGTVYEGGFYQNRNHGQGTFTYPDGRQQSGTWEHGEPVG